MNSRSSGTQTLDGLIFHKLYGMRPLPFLGPGAFLFVWGTILGRFFRPAVVVLMAHPD